MSPGAPLGRKDVEAAAARIAPFLRSTPLLHSPGFDAWLKVESLQRTGAYKVRGALNALLLQVERGDRRRVIAASAGNHGAGVAWAADRLGLEATIVVPRTAPRVKVARIRASGAEVVVHGQDFEESLAWAREAASLHSWRFLHAFDDPDIIAGQGTLALELLSMSPDVVLVPVGGGGLAAGCSLVLRSEGIRVVGVQVEGVDALASHLRGGPSCIVPRATVADGLKVREAGMLTRALCRHGLSEILLVTEANVRSAMARLDQVEQITAEGAGAVATAALSQVSGQRRVAIVSGGNHDGSMGRPTRFSKGLPSIDSRLLFN